MLVRRFSIFILLRLGSGNGTVEYVSIRFLLESIMSIKLRQLFMDNVSKLCDDFELDRVPDKLVKLFKTESVLVTSFKVWLKDNC
ncbi:hypothetical protein BpHYR1_018831 [Brachionus plicatilis]|uniref:Uncharacterized protein n=1 Tax=Brachionus plicatilis TaxID=10195 RepID=A0A3M7QRR9_BRAPC|nr:hypothetical protein BpHYR1_018831 [Brachionus plicatilis]